MKKSFLSLLSIISVIFFFVACGTESKNSVVNESSTEQKVSANSLSEVFEVIDFLPGEELPSEATYPTIQIQFSEPVIALQELGNVANSSPYMTIEPEIKGTYRWLGTSLLSFVASDEIIAQKIYTVKIAPDMVSVSGKSLSGSTEFQFHTEELKITSIIAGFDKYKNGKESVYYSEYWPLSIPNAMDLGICFNAPVNPQVIEKYLKITDSDSKVYEYKIEASGLDDKIKNAQNIVHVTINEKPKYGTKLTISLPIGASAYEDSYKTTKVSSEIIPIKEKFAFNSASSNSDTSGYKNSLEFNFNSEIKLGQEEKIVGLLSFDKDIKISKENVSISYYSVILHDLPLDYEDSYVVTMQPGLEDTDGNTITESIVQSATIPKAKGYVNYKSYESFAMLEAKYTPRLAFMHRNITKGNYTITPLTGLGGNASSKESQTYAVEPGEKNKATLETVELSPALDQSDSGQFHGAVEFSSTISYPSTEYDWKTRSYKPTIRTNNQNQIIQVTDLGATVRYGYNQAAVLVSSLETGKPIANAEVSAYYPYFPWENYTTNLKNFIKNPDSQKKYGSAITNEQGLAVIDLDYPSKGTSYTGFYIHVKTKDDSAIFQPRGHNLWNSSVEEIGSTSEGYYGKNLAFMYTDRGLYKPGETVTVKIIDRTLAKGQFSPYTGKYNLSLKDPWWGDVKTYQTKKGTANKFGSSWAEFKIPEDMKPGEYCISYSRDGDSSDNEERCYINVQYFQAAKFEVKSSINKDNPYYSGDKISATISSNYLGGGNMGQSSYKAYWTCEPTSFNPGEKFADMSFGPIEGYYDGRSDLDNTSGLLDGAGSAKLIQTSGGEKIKGLPYCYTLNATVTDSGNQDISSQASVTVHPAKFYLGLSKYKNVSGYPSKNSLLKFDYVCTDVNGESPASSVLPKDKTIKMELLHEEWEEVNQLAWNGEVTTRWNKKLVSDLIKTINLSGKKDATEISVTPESAGAYILRLSTKDSEGNDIITEQSFYVTGSDWYWFNKDDAEEIALDTDKSEYKVGETAHILMRSPLPKGTYLITLEREGLIDKQIQTINEPSCVLDFLVKDSYTPIMYVAVSSFSTRTEETSKKFTEKDMGRPKGYFGVTAINVSSQSRTFEIDIKTDKANYEPGSKAKIKVHASNKSGPVKNAEITLMAVDRGVLDLINYHVDNPLEYFYDRSNFPECVSGGDSRSILIDPITYTANSQFGGDKGDGDSVDGSNPIRSNFNPLALFMPSMVTNENGDAECTFTLPDSLTAYRITAVGHTVDKFSLSEAEFNVANKISVRSVLPRQLRLKDKSEIGVTISNISESDQNVGVSAKIVSGVQQYDDDIQKLPGNLSVLGDQSKSISVPADSSKTLMFNVEATESGWVTIEFEIKSNLLNEKLVLPLQIEKPYIYETVTTIGSTDGTEENESVAERIIIPGDAEDDMGSLYVQLDPTRLGVLKEAVDYTFHYPYGCLEQRSSAILPLVIFGEYIKTFGLDSEVKNPKSVIEKEIKNWGSSQLGNGSFPYWPGSNYSNSYVTTRIAEVVGIAKQKGYKIQGIDTKELAKYLKTNAQLWLQDANISAYKLYDAAHQLYAASILNEVDGVDVLADRIMENKQIDASIISLCGLIYDNLNQISKRNDAAKMLKSKISLTSQGADLYDADYNEYWSMYSDSSEKFALAVQLLTRVNPDDQTVQHLIFELLQLQKLGKGYWKSTCATARVLTAFDEYIRTNNLTNLNFTAEALLNKKSVLKGDFEGASALAVDQTFDFSNAPISDLPKDKEVELLFKKKGNGKLFYTASLKYAIPAEKQFAREEGLCVFTEIYDAETSEKITSNKLVAGKTYIQKVCISSTRNRQYVAMRVPVPAGCEIMNAAFVTTGTIPSLKQSSAGDTYNIGLSYQGIYDSEVQYFWDYFPRGHQEVQYAFRAVRNGEYNTPSSTAECMYEPEIFGRSSGTKWTIE